MRSRTLIAAATLLALGAVACHRQPPATEPTPVRAVTSARDSADAVAGRRADSISRVAWARRDSIFRAMARQRTLRDSLLQDEDARRLRESADLAAMEAPIHFDFDRVELRPEASATLDVKIAILLRHVAMTIRIEGNCDERGSDEYNLLLGTRRAATARRYLVDAGIDEARIAIVSYGEERPLCTTHDETCWQRNRRADFAITSGERVVASRTP